MKASREIVRVLCTEEACVLVPYPDGPHMSVGFGHNDPNLTPNDPPITVQQAIDLLIADLAPREAAVSKMFAVPVLQQEFDAIFDAYYNKGSQVRPVVNFINEGRKGEAIDLLRTINRNASGQYMAGLARRREREINIFLHGDYGDLSKMKLWRGDPHKSPPEIIPFPEGF